MTTRRTEATSRKRRTSDETRELLLTTAEKLFAEKGPDAVGIKDVALAAGVSHPLVVHYFGTYEELVQAVLQQRNRALAETVLQHVMSTSGPLGSGALLAAVLKALSDPVHARLLAWTALSGNAHRLAVVRNHGMLKMVDAMETRVASDARAAGKKTPKRDAITQTMLVGAATVLGFATCRSILLPAFGLSDDAESAAVFEKALQSMLQRQFE